jgi:CheY-like chemotaxis protein
MPDAEMLSVLSFALETNGYKVLTANTATEAIAKFTGHQIDVLLVTQAQQKPTNTSPGGAELINRFKMIQPGIHTLLFYEDGKFPLDAPGDACCALPFKVVDLLDRIKILASRKRGPHLGYKKPVGAVSQSQPASLIVAGV